MVRTAISATPDPAARGALCVALGLGFACLTACEGDRGPAGPPANEGEETRTEYERGEEAPLLLATILAVEGAGGPVGDFQAGDRVSVRFRLETEDGSPWELSELVSGQALLSGPTFNYQRVLPLVDDVLARAECEGDGVFRYVFADPLPTTFAPPYHDSSSFGPEHGELAGEPLLDGTYTVGLSFLWNYTVDGAPFQRVGEAAFEIAFGPSSGALVPRAVSQAANCNRCHIELQAHEGRYRTLTLCLMCHTAGAEDLNDPDVGGGTPGVSIDSRRLFHRIHAGRSLPSVLGIGVHSDGTRDYGATPRPLVFAGDDGTLHDFSDVGFPAMPTRKLGMPPDTGYDALGPAQQRLEDANLRGPNACTACHGDPDGDGPLEAPSQSEVIVRQLSRRACGSCHDDIDFEREYRVNAQVMPPQPDDTQCVFCHDATFPSPLSPIDAHLHPLTNPMLNPGTAVELLSVSEAGANNGNGAIDPGERVSVSFAIRNADGSDADPDELRGLRALVSGPSSNPQVLLDVELPPALLGGSQPFSSQLPMKRGFEFVGNATAVGGDTFQTALAPHLIGEELASIVRLRTGGTGASSVASGAVPRHSNFIDVADAAGFARDDYLVVDEGLAGFEEYARVLLVEGDRLWISSSESVDKPTGWAFDHPAGAVVRAVELTLLEEGVDYSLDSVTGELTELAELGAGNGVIVSYTTLFVMPDEYLAPANDSPDLGESRGEWTGKSLVAGTYQVGLTASRDVDFFAPALQTTFLASSEPAVLPFLVGTAAVLEPPTSVPSGALCADCHLDLTFHGGRDRGFETCILCHGASGAEDLPRFLAANAPETPGGVVDFRFLVHRIHSGRSSGAPSFESVARGSDPYPNNFDVRSYANFGFPAQPGGALHCDQCHGDDDPSKLFPTDRDHPTEQQIPVLEWTPVCAGCHGSPEAGAHMEANTAPSGAESCRICHGEGEEEDVTLVHRVR